jgi:diphthine-ammonia ligase
MVVELQAIGPSQETAVVAWTGGKDCNLALLRAWRDPSLRVAALVCFHAKGSTFRAHPIALMKAQAESLNLPLILVTIETNETTPTYKQAYVAGMHQLRTDHGITVMATGDMELVGTNKTNWIQECGEEAGIRAYLPLWQADRETCLQQLVEEDFEVVFSCVKSPFFDSQWIGRRLNAESLAALKDMSQSQAVEGNDHQPLDLGGEGGEYHTMCLDGPLYTRPVEIVIGPETFLQEIDPVEGQKPEWQGNIHFAVQVWTINLDRIGKEQH